MKAGQFYVLASWIVTAQLVLGSVVIIQVSKAILLYCPKLLQVNVEKILHPVTGNIFQLSGAI